MPYYCPVDGKYSDKFPSEKARDDHIILVHPDSPEARLLTERRRKGYAQEQTGGKVST